MILLLVGAVTSSVSGARRRAKTQQAIAEAQQLTDAILAYENYSRPGEKSSPLDDVATQDSWMEASEGNMNFVLGTAKMPNGQAGNVPVLFNGAVRNGKIRDPWGHAYQYRILSAALNPEDDHTGSTGDAAFAIPNINRISADEVN
jgi:hypothetical protein